MEEKFVNAWLSARATAQSLGVRLRPMDPKTAMQTAHRCLSGNRESDGFYALAQMGRLELSLEALAVSKTYTGLFTDEEANRALERLMHEGYF